MKGIKTLKIKRTVNKRKTKYIKIMIKVTVSNEETVTFPA